MEDNLLICKYCYYCDYYYILNNNNNCYYCINYLKKYNLQKVFYYYQILNKKSNSLLIYKILTLYNLPIFYYNLLNNIIKFIKHIVNINDIDLLWIVVGAFTLREKRHLYDIYIFDEFYMLSLDFHMSIIFHSDYNLSLSNWIKYIHNNDKIMIYYYNYYLYKLNYNIYINLNNVIYNMEILLNLIKY